MITVRVPAVLLLALLVFRAPGAAAMLRVVPAGGSITAVLNEASPGDTVWLEGSDYRENLRIEVPVVLTGEGYPTIRGGYEGSVIDVLANGTVLKGLHVSEAGTFLTRDLACILVQADSVQVLDCRITRPLHGIYVKGGSWTLIRGNRIEGRLDLVEEDRGNGIHLWNSKRNHVLRNEILNVRDGIYFSFADSTLVEENYIHGVRYGLHYMYSNYNRFVDNLFEENVAGAALMYSYKIVFLRNVFARCRGFRAYGILFQSMDSTLAESNLILDNSRGIFMNNTDFNTLINNDIVDNDLAIQLNGGCEGNRFLRNNFINNLSRLLLDVSDRETIWADSTGGNFWSGYRGYDLDRDGVGDVPFDIQNVFQIMETKVPEVRFYLFSPAAEILKAAERSMPILDLGKASDNRPLMNHSRNAGVPWDRVREIRTASSPIFAVLFLLGFLLQGIYLVRSTRGPGRGR